MNLSLTMQAPLDPDFLPAILANRDYRDSVNTSGAGIPLVIGLEREDGLCSRHQTIVLPDSGIATLRYAERLVKFLLWARGGWRIWIGGSAAIGRHIQRLYVASGARNFDVDLMGGVYEKPFEVVVTDVSEVPPAKESAASIGGHLDGCRIGFDLGASDYKVAAVRDGEVVFSSEFPWNPKDEPDPQYHYDHLNSALKEAARHLPRVDAIGGSSAGVIVGNKIMAASLIRAVPPEKFDQAKKLFLRIRDEWNVPVAVANDGDVTALAGAMSLQAKGMLGIAMGSSQAAGYLNPDGCMTGWLSELAFAPVDYNPHAAADEWSGDRGVGALYFSQQAVDKLLPAAGISVPAEMGLPERLKEVQRLMAAGDLRAAKIYETIGVYLGFAIPHYAEFYDFENILILGRVTSGGGGDIVIEKAREVLKRQFPELAERIAVHVPDEKSRRVGQAVAAASLPLVKRET